MEIETGRYTNGKNDRFLEREHRYCTLCYENGIKVVGDELHALLKCPNFDKQRDKCMKSMAELCPHFMSLDDNSKVLYMLTCENESINCVARFINQVCSFQRPRFSTIKMKILAELDG